jgi:hypothetical protein
MSAWRCCVLTLRLFTGAGLEICDSRASSREMASFNCLATPGSLARRIVARRRARNLFDLAGDGIEPLMNVRDIRRPGSAAARAAGPAGRENPKGRNRRWWN